MVSGFMAGKSSFPGNQRKPALTCEKDQKKISHQSAGRVASSGPALILAVALKGTLHSLPHKLYLLCTQLYKTSICTITMVDNVNSQMHWLVKQIRQQIVVSHFYKLTAKVICKLTIELFPLSKFCKNSTCFYGSDACMHEIIIYSIPANERN